MMVSAKRRFYLITLLAAFVIFGTFAIRVHAADDEETDDGAGENTYMAHNIYVDPEQTGHGEYSTYLIDFCGTETPECTYWALCNWQMKGGFGAYCGLQNTIDGRMAIISFWEGEKNGKMLTASRIYPYGSNDRFGGEGEGTHYIGPYAWQTGKWYRMLLLAWDDSVTGTTFVGEWFEDKETGKWTLISYYDTKLKKSALTGGMSMFQENYSVQNPMQKRSFKLKNLYAYDKKQNEWNSLHDAYISYDPASWGFNTAGTHEFGAGEDYFWGKAGESVADQTAYDAGMPMGLMLSINQPQKPDFPEGGVSSISIEPQGKKTLVSWEVPAVNAPVYSYTVLAYDNEGKKLAEANTTRPEYRSIEIAANENDIAKIVIKTKDAFRREHEDQEFFGEQLKQLESEPVIAVKGKLDAAGMIRELYGTDIGLVKFKTDNKKIATISRKGILTARKAGDVTVTAYSKTGNKYRAECRLTVHVTRPVLDLKDMDLTYEGQQIDARRYLSGVPELSSVKWSIADKYSDAATIDTETGIITAGSKNKQKVKVNCTISAYGYDTKYTINIWRKTPKFANGEKAVALKTGKAKTITLKNVSRYTEVKWSCDEPELKIEKVSDKRTDRVKVSVPAEKATALAGQTIPVYAEVDGVKYKINIKVK